jgi:mevalonate kinase
MHRSPQHRASASAKIILLGEHAAVYGQPAIAAPVSSLRAYAWVRPNPPGRTGLHIAARDLRRLIPVVSSTDDVQTSMQWVVHAIMALEPAVRVLPDYTLHIRSDIPIASGLGSGAAVATAAARSLLKLRGRSLDSDALNRIIYQGETYHHGTPSGIDNTVIVYERPIAFRRDHAIETLTVGAPLHLVIGDTGVSASTKVSVGDVRRLVEREPARTLPVIEAIGLLAAEARIAIERGDAWSLGLLMTRNHALLQQLTVSHPALDRLVSAAHEAGALGAKLSGGGRGGNMIALVLPETRERVADALREAGAVRTFTTEVRPTA